MQTRKCSVCQKDIPLTLEYFYGDKSRACGFSYMCKECAKRTRNASYVKKDLAEYTLYSGEEVLVHGTAEEISKKMGILVSTLRWYGCKAYEKRHPDGYRLVRVDK